MPHATGNLSARQEENFIDFKLHKRYSTNMPDEEVKVGNDDYKDRASKIFARFGVSVDPQQIEGSPDNPDNTVLTAELDHKEGVNGNESSINLTLERDFLQVLRDIYSKNGSLIAGIGCSADISNGVVDGYKLRFVTQKLGYVVELSPDGIVTHAYQEYSPNSDDYEKVAPSIQKFPSFPILFQKLATATLNPDQPSSLFSPIGNLPKELEAELGI